MLVRIGELSRGVRVWPLDGTPFVQGVLNRVQVSVLGRVEQVDFVAILAVDDGALGGHLVEVRDGESELALGGALDQYREHHRELLGGTIGAPAVEELLVVHLGSSKAGSGIGTTEGLGIGFMVLNSGQ